MLDYNQVLYFICVSLPLLFFDVNLWDYFTAAPGRGRVAAQLLCQFGIIGRMFRCELTAAGREASAGLTASVLLNHGTRISAGS